MTYRTISGRAGRATLLSLCLVGCHVDSEQEAAALEARAAAATQLPPARALGPRVASPDSVPAVQPVRARRALSPLADTIASSIVFAPRVQTWFTASARGKRMLVDLGRVDVEVRRSPERLAAFREAAEDRSPVPIGTRLLLRAPWGAEEVTVTAIDLWNGRVVAVVQGSPRLDSLVRGRSLLPASAQLVRVAYAARDSTASPGSSDSTQAAPAQTPPPARWPTSPCRRDSLSPDLAFRLTWVRDSIDAALRTAAAVPGYDAPQGAVTVRSSQAVGCFGEGHRVALVVNIRSADNSYVRERVILLDNLGRVTPLRANDLRFKAHDLVYALDADGDGVDDLATRATTAGAGATVILRYDPTTKRLGRLSSGFTWESR